MLSFFGKQNALDPPPMARNANAVEILRVWADPGDCQQMVINTFWEEPAAWGLLMVDIARHAAKAYAKEGYDEAKVFARILAGLQAELEEPTDDPKDITDDSEDVPPPECN